MKIFFTGWMVFQHIFTSRAFWEVAAESSITLTTMYDTALTTAHTELCLSLPPKARGMRFFRSVAQMIQDSSATQAARYGISLPQLMALSLFAQELTASLCVYLCLING